MEKSKEKIFVVGKNTAEEVAIADMLKANGYIEGKNLLITKQNPKASWRELEPEIKDAIKEVAQRHEVTRVRYSDGQVREIIQGKLPEISSSGAYRPCSKNAT